MTASLTCHLYSACLSRSSLVTLGLAARGERILFFWPNTNTNNIRNQNSDRIQIWIILRIIRIIFVFSEWANTNTNNIRAQIFGRIRIRIIFGFRIVPQYEYEYYVIRIIFEYWIQSILSPLNEFFFIL